MQRQSVMQQSLFPVYQPIIDIKKQMTIGFEALIRSHENFSPFELFAAAKVQNSLLEFDRRCRSTSFKEFQGLSTINSNPLLFVNIDVSTLDESEAVEGWIIDQVQKYGLTNQQVALEIVESNVKSTHKLTDFVDRHKQAGFLIVLDDFGESHSNLNRIVLLKPDIIKIDKALINAIHTDYYKQSIVHAITRLCNKIGAITLAEGVETKDEFLICYELGIQLFQGYYFSKPKQTTEFPLTECAQKLNLVLPELNKHIKAKVQLVKQNHLEFEKIVMSIISLLDTTPSTVEEALTAILETQKQIECLYILNEHGVQISSTVCGTQHQKMHPLFSPSSIKTNHSLKDYYYSLKHSESKRFITDPYISLATGNICHTISVQFNLKNQPCILCVDVIS